MQCTVYCEVLSTIAHLHEEIKDIRRQYKLVFSTPHVVHRADCKLIVDFVLYIGTILMLDM